MKNIDQDEIAALLFRNGHTKPEVSNFTIDTMGEYFIRLKAWQEKADYLTSEIMNGRHIGRQKVDIPGSRRTDDVHSGIQDEVANTIPFDDTHI